MAYQKASYLQSATSSSDPAPSGTQWNAVVLTATTYSAPVFVGDCEWFSIQLTSAATASPSWAWTIEASNDFALQNSEVPDAGLVNWFTVYVTDEVAGSAVNTKAVSNATAFLGSVKDCAYKWVRVKATKTSNNCTTTGIIQKKGIPS